MRLVNLGDSGVEVGAVGFGCAGLFRIPSPVTRRRTLDRAFELGFRHFDVAPMYGLGLAEPELGSMIQRRRESVTIATKFGIAVTPLGALAGRFQSPVRQVLEGNRSLGNAVKTSGSTPTSGLMGKMLYRSLPYNAKSAREELERSLRYLRTDYIDLFMLHQPPIEAGVLTPELLQFLERQKERGTIREWGVAGDYTDDAAEILSAFRESPLLQVRDDALSPHKTQLMEGGRATITFGALARPLALLKRFFDQYPKEAGPWSEATGIDVTADGNLCGALIEIALQRNRGGPILVTTSNIEHLESLATIAGQPSFMTQPDPLDSFTRLISVAQAQLSTQSGAA